MNLYINGRFLSRRPTGVDRFALEVIKGIDRLLDMRDPLVDGVVVKVVVPGLPIELPRFSCIEIVKVGRSAGQIWEQTSLPSLIRGSDLLLNLCNTGPVFCRNQVVVIHDAATVKVPSAFSAKFRLWYSFLMPLLGWRSKRVLTVSNFSKRDISDSFRIDFNKIGVVVEGGEHIRSGHADEAIIDRLGLRGRSYVLAVSSMAPHKNFRVVLEALALLRDLDIDVVIAGGANPKVFGGGDRAAIEGVKWAGYVTDDELRALYAHAESFVFPSLYEGFGIPPLEAMACGCPVIASTGGAIPEVCGDAVLYFSPSDVGALAGHVRDIHTNLELRKSLVQKGAERLQAYSWDEAAKGVVRECKGVCL